MGKLLKFSSWPFGETEVSDEMELDNEGLVHKDVSDDVLLRCGCVSEIGLINSVAVVVVVVVAVSTALSFDNVSLSSCNSLLVVVAFVSVW